MSHRSFRSGRSTIVILLAAWLAGEVCAQGRSATQGEALDILVVAPHPDDEALGCAGVILQALEKKQRVGVVLVTNGDGFPKAAAVVAGKAEAELEAADFMRLARLRQQHSLGAMTRIGVRSADLMFLGYPDSILKTLYESRDETPLRQRFTARTQSYGALVRDYHSLAHGQPAPYTRASILDDLGEIIRMRRPKEIYVTSEVDLHPDHQATFWFTRDAAKAAGHRGPLLTFVVHGKPPTEGPQRRVALTAAEVGRKRAIIAEYQTGLSPIHDDLAEKYARPEESFWPILAQ